MACLLGCTADDQPHADGYLEPLADLATPPSYFRTWPYSLSLKAARRVVSLLPPSAQANLPPFLLPAAEHHDQAIFSANGNGDASTQPVSATRGKKGKKARDSTPRDSPAATEGESEDEEVKGENGEPATGEKKKKKPGLGKAGGARRRKMAMK